MFPTKRFDWSETLRDGRNATSDINFCFRSIEKHKQNGIFKNTD